MADAITILSSGAQQNVATVMSGVSKMLSGYTRGRVPLELQRKGSNVSLPGYSTLRLLLTVAAPTNRHGWEGGLPIPASLHVSVEALRNGHWTTLHEFLPQNDAGTQEAIVSGLFDGSVRASWYWARHGAVETGIDAQTSFTFGVTAEAFPATT